MRAPKGLPRLRDGFWRMLLVVTLCAVPVIGQGAEEQEDWVATIAQLKEQWYQRPGQPRVREQLAIAYNNYAVSLAGRGQFTEAVAQSEEARQLEPESTQFASNLANICLQAAQAAYQAHQLSDTKQWIDRALLADAHAAQAYVLLGELEYQRQRLKEAKQAWEQALALDPQAPGVQERLAKLKQELPVESTFDHVSQSYFDIRYPEQFDRSLGFDIRDALLDARRSIGSDFSFWHRHQLIVLLYTDEQFRRWRQDVPDWVAGQYDGKIRVPLPGGVLDRDAVDRILLHEYTHAIVHEVTQDRCPIWFNEGLAEFEGWKTRTPKWTLLKKAAAEQRLIPWNQLVSQFSTTLSAQEVSLAYEQSHSVVAYLVERYGWWRIRRLLKALADHTPLETAMQAEFRQEPSRLETEWRKWLLTQLGLSS